MMRYEPSAPVLVDEAASTPVYAYQSEPSAVYDHHSHQQQHQLATSDKILVGAWDAGFCSCLNHVVPNACMAWCCPWVSLAQITARLRLSPFAKTLLVVLLLHVGAWTGFWLGLVHPTPRHHRHDEEKGPIVNRLGRLPTLVPGVTLRGGFSAWYLLSVACSAALALGVARLRGQVRDRFQISGSRAWDCAAAACCTCCTVAQIATHVKSYAPGSCSFAPPHDTLPAYL